MSLTAVQERSAAAVRAPDGSDVRPLVQTERGSLATFRLAAGHVSGAVVHRSVDEVWYVVAGRGQMWRSYAGAEEISVLEPGLALTLPVGTSFQFRADPDRDLHVVGVTMPPWPGAHEAMAVDGPW